MKKLILFFLLAVSFQANYAQDEKYIKAVEKNMAMMDTAKNASEYLELSNNFERIAKAEKSKWIPYYYSAYCQVIANFIDTDKEKRDVYLEKAENLIAAADSLQPENSEIYTLKGLIAQGRMAVDPMQRWQKYGAASSGYLQKAKELDTANPRPDYLIGQSLLYIPEAFGGGKAKALPLLNDSMAKYKVFKPESSISPNWGEKALEAVLAKIKE